jgi:hypothetical protein
VVVYLIVSWSSSYSLVRSDAREEHVPAFTALGSRRAKVVIDASTKVGRSGPYMVTWLRENAGKSANEVLRFRYSR